MGDERPHPSATPHASRAIDYERLLAALPVVAYQSIRDPATGSGFRVVYVSDRVRALCGYTAPELLADPDLYLGTIIHPDDRDRILGLTRDSAVSDEAQTADYRLVHRDGHVVWVRDHREPRPLGDGRTATQGILLDITAQVEAELERTAAEQRFRTFVERLPSVVYVEDARSDLPFLYISPQIEQIIGYTPAEFYADSRLFQKVTHPEDLGTMLDGYGEHGRKYAVDYRLIHRDGRTVWVHDEATTLDDPAAGEGTIYGIITDITAQRLAEEALARSEERFRAMVEQLPLVVFVSSLAEDPAGAPVYVSPRVRDLLGRDPEEFYTDRGLWRSMVHPEDVARVYDGSATAPDGSEKLEYRMRTADGREIIVREASGPMIAGPDGLFRQGYVIDVTERRQAAEALRRAEKAESLAVLAGGIAHDFNNILVAILGNADLAAMEIAEDHPARTAIDQIRTASLRAADLARQMLAYSGRSRFVVEPVDIGAIASEMAEILRIAVGRGTGLSLDLGRDVPAVEGDPTGLRQVVMNLVVNAGEAIGDSGGTIRLTTSTTDLDAPKIAALTAPGDAAPGRFACLEVADTGHGMDGATVARIFEPYFSTKFIGRGLGLAAVVGIVGAHHGAISVASAPGRGTHVRVYLPATDKPARTPGLEPPVREGGAGTILVVDDEPTVLSVAVRILGRAGYRTVSAPDGATALERFRDAGPIDLVLLDVTMPGLTGAETHARIRELNHAIPVIAMSGFSEEETQRRFAAVGPVGFIAKPFTPAALGDAVARALRPLD